MTEKMVTAKVFRVGCAPSVEQIDANLEGLQEIVGGYIEGITLEPGYILYCNEDGRAKGLSPNLQLPNGVVVLGDAVLVLHNLDGEAISLTEHEPEAIRKAVRHLAEDGVLRKHTPIPWSDNFEKGNGQILHRARGMEIARCSLPDYGLNYHEMKEIRQDNATFIVQACNAHDPLLEAAKLGRDYLKKFADDACKGQALFMAAAVDVDVEKIEKAIALAEGKTGGRLPYEKPRIIDEFPPTQAA
jgi:hypothetical protein